MVSIRPIIDGSEDVYDKELLNERVRAVFGIAPARWRRLPLICRGLGLEACTCKRKMKRLDALESGCNSLECIKHA